MVLQMTMRTDRRNGREGVLQPAAVDHDGVVLLAEAGDELVHDADVGADEGILCVLAEQGDLGQLQVEAGGAEDGEGGGNLDRGRRAEAGAEGDVARDGEGEAIVDGDAMFAQCPENAGGIVGPMNIAPGAQRGKAVVEQVGDALVDALVIVDGVGQDAAVRALGDGDNGGEVDGRGHDKAVAVVGVLADEVDAAGRGVERAGNLVGGKVEGGKFSVGLHGLFHCSMGSICKSKTGNSELCSS